MKRAPIIPKTQRPQPIVAEQSTPAAPMVDSLLSRVGALAKGNSISLPICGREVKLTLKVIPADQIASQTKVWHNNERDQELLTEESLDDLIPSFLLSGQQNPAYGREFDDVIEVADGSRRRKTAILTSTEYRILVGDLDDEQMDALCNLGNNYRPTSAFERGSRYKKRLDHEFAGNITALAEAEHISRKIITRCINTASLPRELIALFSQPGDLSARAGDDLSRLFSANATDILATISELNQRKTDGEKFEAEAIISLLTNSGKADRTRRTGLFTKKVFTAGATAQYKDTKILLSLDPRVIPVDIISKIESVLEEYSASVKP